MRVKEVMAAKKVASALHVLTSDSLSGCDDWSDNNAFEALVTDYFTGSGYDSTEESDNDDIGISLLYFAFNGCYTHNRQCGG